MHRSRKKFFHSRITADLGQLKRVSRCVDGTPRRTRVRSPVPFPVTDQGNSNAQRHGRPSPMALLRCCCMRGILAHPVRPACHSLPKTKKADGCEPIRFARDSRFRLENELHHEPAGKPVIEYAVLPVSWSDRPVLRWVERVGIRRASLVLGVCRLSELRPPVVPI